jgi:hypothetical protein
MMMTRHKLVTVFLHDKAESGRYGDPKANPLFGVTEHLENYLKEGWAVKDLRTLGGAGGCLSGWVVVLLEK